MLRPCLVAIVVIGRAYCPVCQVTRTVVRDVRCELPLKCPTCDGETTDTSGDD